MKHFQQVFRIQKLRNSGSAIYFQRSTPQLGFVARIKGVMCAATIVLHQILRGRYCRLLAHIRRRVQKHKQVPLVKPTKTELLGPRKVIVIFDYWISQFEVGRLLFR